MKKRLYIKRLKSETPKALKKVQKIAGSISAGTAIMASSLAAFEKTQSFAIILGIISGITAGISAGCQFATTDETLTNV